MPARCIMTDPSLRLEAPFHALIAVLKELRVPMSECAVEADFEERFTQITRNLRPGDLLLVFDRDCDRVSKLVVMMKGKVEKTLFLIKESPSPSQLLEMAASGLNFSINSLNLDNYTIRELSHMLMGIDGEASGQLYTLASFPVTSEGEKYPGMSAVSFDEMLALLSRSLSEARFSTSHEDVVGFLREIFDNAISLSELDDYTWNRYLRALPAAHLLPLYLAYAIADMEAMWPKTIPLIPPATSSARKGRHTIPEQPSTSTLLRVAEAAWDQFQPQWRYDKILPICEAAWSLGPGTLNLRKQYGCCLAAAGDLQAVVQLEPARDQAAYYFACGKESRNTGQFQASLQFLEKALQLCPDAEMARDEYSLARALNDDWEWVKEHAPQSSMFPGTFIAQRYFWCHHYASNLPEPDHALLLDILESNIKPGVSWVDQLWRVMLRILVGDTESALDDLERLLRRYPQHRVRMLAGCFHRLVHTGMTGVLPGHPVFSHLSDESLLSVARSSAEAVGLSMAFAFYKQHDLLRKSWRLMETNDYADLKIDNIQKFNTIYYASIVYRLIGDLSYGNMLLVKFGAKTPLSHYYEKLIPEEVFPDTIEVDLARLTF